jgi:predicted transcriptional regulator
MHMDNDSMSKEDRREVILQFMADTGLALPPAPLYYNMKEEMFVTFSKRTMQRLLKEMRGEGLVCKIEQGDGYWKVTDEGREYLQNADDGRT